MLKALVALVMPVAWVAVALQLTLTMKMPCRMMAQGRRILDMAGGLGRVASMWLTAGSLRCLALWVTLASLTMLKAVQSQAGMWACFVVVQRSPPCLLHIEMVMVMLLGEAVAEHLGIALGPGL